MLRSARFSLSVLAALILLSAQATASARAVLLDEPPIHRDYWPTLGWQVSTPEAQGMDSRRLEQLRRNIAANYPQIRSVVVVRHGDIVFEYVREGVQPDEAYPVHSVTKSVMSALVGAALQQGYLLTLDQPVVDFFPDYAALEVDPRLHQVTLRHILTMSSGLQDPGFERFLDSPDWFAYGLQRTIATNPGAAFGYTNPAAHLLSGVIARATGQNAQDFARQVLFDPLGIVDFGWRLDPNGNPDAAGGLLLTPRDMAKFGYLYLNDGVWDGQRILPEGWVGESTSAQIEGGPPEYTRYGYLWWITRVDGHDAYFASGYGGQYLYVVPDLDLVAVIASNDEWTHGQNRALVADDIIPAVMG
jgi:CubicO group peptidase (beta-lactamase class C family)